MNKQVVKQKKIFIEFFLSYHLDLDSDKFPKRIEVCLWKDHVHTLEKLYQEFFRPILDSAKGKNLF